MIAEQVVASMLVAAAPVTALIGAGAAARIFEAGKAPQNGARPYLTYQRISSASVVGTTLEGASGLDAIRVQINCWDDRFGGNAVALGQVVRQALHGKSGPGPSQQSVQCTAPVDADSEDKLQIEGARLDAIVTMNEAAEAA